MSQPEPVSIEELLERVGDLFEDKVYGAVNHGRCYDIEKAAYLIATFESAHYFLEHMRLARNFSKRGSLLKHALQSAQVEGLVLEFGVGEGASLNFIAQHTDATVYGFDSFEGLPEDWTHFQRKGRFDRGSVPPDNLPDNVEIVKGWFQDTLPTFMSEHSEPIRFALVDCDLYASTKLVLDHIASRLQVGSVIVFDEYLNYPGWKHHEFKAFQECVQEHGLNYEYIGFISSRWYVAAKITGIKK